MGLNKPKRKTPPSTIYSKEYFFFDGHQDSYSRGILAPEYREVLGHLEAKSNEAILDIGCGRGELVNECRKLGADVIGVDYSQAAVKISKETLNEGIIVRASASDLPFRNGTFDKIILHAVLEHLDQGDTLKCVREMGRVLKLEGIVLIQTANKWEKLLSPLHDLHNLLFPKQRLNPKERYYLKVTHVNAPSPISLKRMFRKEGFDVEIWFSTPKRGETALWKVIIYRMLFFTLPLWAIACKRRSWQSCEFTK